MKKRIVILAAIVGMCSIFSAGCGGNRDSAAQTKKKTITLTVWHYYNGALKNAFDKLVSKFNETEGPKQGIYIEAMSKGSVSDLETAVQQSADGEVGSDEMPDIFSTYADAAYEIEQKGKLANLSEYLSDKELSEYVDSYVEEGYIGMDHGLRIFPVAKSSEIMMVNKTDWDVFAQETGTDVGELATLEGVVEVSKKYYEWTDAQTPDVPGDGKAFYGRDSMPNYFVIGMRQLGYDIFEVKDGKVQINANKEAVRKLWDNYYVPFVKGYFAAYGSFRSDDVKTGDLLAYTGSTTSAMYFPEQVAGEENVYDVECMILSAPKFAGGENYEIQQGAGMVVTKTDKEREQAAVTFLKWFTQAENNLSFGSTSGYFPVRKDANSKKKLDEVIKEQKIEVNEITYNCLSYIMDNESDTTKYTMPSFEHAYEARKVLQNSLWDKSKADRASVVAAMQAGADLDSAAAPYVTDVNFENWYTQFCEELNQAVEP